MSVCVIEGLKGGKKDCAGTARWEGIPKGSRVVVLALPDMKVVIDATNASAVVADDLDPGKYRVNVSKFQEMVKEGMTYSYDFYHGCDEEMYKAVSHLRATLVKSIQTSKGPRYRCKVFQCENEATSRFGALKHQATHFGVDLEDAIRTGDKAALAKMTDAAELLLGQIRASEKEKRTALVKG